MDPLHPPDIDRSQWPPEGVPLHFPNETGCFGCSPHNPEGLHLAFERRGDYIVGRYAAPTHLAGGPRMVHGGILALLLDEYACAAAYHLGGRYVVTGSLNVRYEHPAPVEAALDIRARLRSMAHPRYWEVESEVRLGEVCIARSEGRFFPVEGTG